MGFQQGLSGLNATSKNLEVIGNNIANSNTYGAKAARAEFADMYASAMNGAGANAIGIGVSLESVSQQFTQGNIASSQNPLDLAINGAGFFQVTDGKNPTMYTRNGQFKVDREGFVVNSQGNKLMGYAADGAGTILPGQATPLQMPTAGITPSPTDRIKLEMNLDARAAVTLPASGAPIDMTDPTTYNNATSLTVFDAKGQDVALTYYFQKAATDTWNVYITANGTPLATSGGNPAPSTTIVFPANGGTPTSPAGTVNLDIPASTNSAGAATLAINGVALNVAGATQYGSPFGVTDLSQNGYAAGQLVGIQFESNGIVTARYSNGQSKPAGQVEIATFRNPQGLQPMGGNAWARTFATGDPIVGVPGDGNLGALQSGALEESNVDMTAELVNMITAQRVYQANAQTIKTQDQVMQTLVNLR
ncbi:flagellar hook protein FlgE [Piscinibacter sp. XHJ-5]|uniref:flagellar hook protein FlgE n=1 Tax=Piscinibacter sp. XHJ-5 TaxID=3037797 RepID=UPI0024530E8B|nr:flagellar hook protein FlgE [Piscinibacter sp. XHJ-5]